MELGYGINMKIFNISLKYWLSIISGIIGIIYLFIINYNQLGSRAIDMEKYKTKIAEFDNDTISQVRLFHNGITRGMAFQFRTTNDTVFYTIISTMDQDQVEKIVNPGVIINKPTNSLKLKVMFDSNTVSITLKD